MRSKHGFLRCAVAFLAAAVVIALGCAPNRMRERDSFRRPGLGPADSPWPVLQHDARHSGYTSLTGPDKPKIKWTGPGTMSQGGVLGPDGTYYVGTEAEEAPGELYAFDRSGKVKWRLPLENPGRWRGGSEPAGVLSSAAVAADGTIYVAAGDKLHAVTPAGKRKWQFATGVPRELREEQPVYIWLSSSPVIGVDGTVYFGSGEGTLYAVRPDGTKKWSFETPGFVRTSPALGSDGTVYFCSNSAAAEGGGAVYALTADGREKWRYVPRSGAQGFSSPVVTTYGAVYVNYVGPPADGTATYLLSLDPDGSTRWARPMRMFGGLPSVAPDGTIYVWDSGMIHAIDREGRTMWSYGKPSPLLRGGGPPAIDGNGVIYAVTGTGDSLTASLVALNRDGAVKWTLAGVRSSAPIAIGGNHELYVGFVSVGEQ